MKKPRNLVATDDIMRKGGVHKKSKSGERSRDKVALKNKTREQDKDE